MKTVFSRAVCAVMMLCAVTVCFAKDINSPEVAVTDTVTVSFKSIKDPVNSVSYKGKTYGPRNDNADTMAEVVFKVSNKGSEVLKSLDRLKNIELVCADKEGVLTVSQWAILFAEEYKAGATQEEFNRNYFHIEEYTIEPNTTFEKKVYFVHPKKLTPVAFTQDRKVVCALYADTDKNASVLAKNLVRLGKIPECFGMVKSSSSEEIRGFMGEYEITFADEDVKGFTLLYYAINHGNNAFLDAAIEGKSDIRHAVPFFSPYTKITPIQFAVLCGNAYAVDKLIAAGEDLLFVDVTNGVTDIGTTVIQQNNVPGAKILAARGYDFSALTIGGGGWTKKQTALEYAESHQYAELAAFLKSVVK